MHEFDTEAMNTSLNMQICGVDYNYARSAAIDNFKALERIENLLSIYIEGSDISLVNCSKVGEIVKLTDIGAECILAAFQAAHISKGAIDICMGEYFLRQKKDSFFKIENPRRSAFEFDFDNYAIRKTADGMIDMGAIGKGFAVDKIVESLVQEWEIKDAFISFGASSIYALGKPDDADSWSINLGGDNSMKIPLSNTAVGASGTAVLGNHILDARTGTIPENQPFRTWAFADSAAIADAMSTAFMILPEDEIKEICKEFEISAAIQQTKDSPITLIQSS